MNKFLTLILLSLFSSDVFAHSDHYRQINKIEMEILRNGKVIGFSNYYFKHKKKNMVVENVTEFVVDVMGVKIFSVKSLGTEIYNEDKLISFKSNTLQNKKKKFVNLRYIEDQNKFFIEGSSFVGYAKTSNVIGNWWNHKLLQAQSQISPLSGSVKNQIVTFIGKEFIILNDKKVKVEKFNIMSKDPNTPEEKRLNFDIWYNKEKALILKISYNRMGNWEYKIKKINESLF